MFYSQSRETVKHENKLYTTQLQKTKDRPVSSPSNKKYSLIFSEEKKICDNGLICGIFHWEVIPVNHFWADLI